jgi:diguanylate cyclase (GGDEF)-like protein
MSEQVTDVPDVERLTAEIGRLRGQIAHLEQRLEELDKLAYHDWLVPLPNRRGFTRQLQRLIARLDRYDEPAAMLYIDVDGLKRVNDRHGHCAGDAALVHIAAVLTQGVRQTDCVARLGGDEFGVLLTRVTREEAQETATRLLETAERGEFFYQGEAVPLSFAVGLTLIQEGDSAEAVMERADKAMYAVKAAA